MRRQHKGVKFDDSVRAVKTMVGGGLLLKFCGAFMTINV